MKSVAPVLLVACGCGRVSFGYPVVPCDEVVSLDSVLGPDKQCFTRHDGPVNAENATPACWGLGGHLATIASQDENDAIVSLGLTGPTLIGLGTKNATPSFVWETGEPLPFTAWAAGYPMYYGGFNSE